MQTIAKFRNTQYDMQQMFKLKNILPEKIDIFKKIFNHQIQKFIIFNLPSTDLSINPMNFHKFIFGNQQNIREFQQSARNLITQFQANVHGIIKIFEVSSLAKVFSEFIDTCIMENFISLFNLMISRQNYCTKLIQKMYQDSVNQKGTIFTKGIPTKTNCINCQQNLQKNKLSSIYNQVILGYKNQLNYINITKYSQVQKKYQQFQDLNFYFKVKQIKQKVHKDFIEPDPGSIQKITHNLGKLQTNIQQKKFQILSYLTQLGQIGNQMINQQKNFQNSSNLSIQLLRNIKQKYNQKTLDPQQLLKQKFNHKQFTFNLSKHFIRNLKDVQNELRKIKIRYRDFLSIQSPLVKDQGTNCNLIQDLLDKQTEKLQKNKEKHQNIHTEMVNSFKERVKQFSDQVFKYQTILSILQKSIPTSLLDKKQEDCKIQLEVIIPKILRNTQHKIKQKDIQIKYLKVQINKTKQLLKQQVDTIYQPTERDSQNKQASFFISNMKEQNKSNKEPKTSNSTSKNLLNINKGIKKQQNSLNQQHLENQKIPINVSTQSYQINEEPEIIDSKDNYKNKRRKTKLMQKQKSVQKQKSIFLNIFQKKKLISNIFYVKIQGSNLNNTKSQKGIQNEKNDLRKKVSKQSSNQINSRKQQRKQTINLSEKNNTKTQKKQQRKVIQISSKKDLNIPKYQSQHVNKKIIKTKKDSYDKFSSIKKQKKSLRFQTTQQNSKFDLSLLKQSPRFPTINIKNQQVSQKYLISKQTATNNLKKKRKLRYFSQQSLSRLQDYQPSKNIDETSNMVQKRKNIKIPNKNKNKLYIIDFIPKQQFQTQQTYKTSHLSETKKLQISTAIKQLFQVIFNKKNKNVQVINIINNNNSNIKLKEIKKQTIKTQDKFHIMFGKQQNLLATKIFSYLASLKYSNHSVYVEINKNLIECYKICRKSQKAMLKNNSDQLTTLNQTFYQLQNSNRLFQDKEQSIFDTWLKKIINFLIIEHKNICLNQKSFKKLIKKSCQHFTKFQQFLIQLFNINQRIKTQHQ